MRYLITVSLFLLIVIVGLFVVPLRRIEEREYGQITESWAGGDLQISFAPSFTKLTDKKWPGWKKGEPYRISVMWISLTPGEVKLRVEKLRLVDGVTPVVLPAREKIGADQNYDRKFYTIVAYDDVALSDDLLKIDLECSLDTRSGTTRKNFELKAKRFDRTRWINSILESVMGI